MKLIYFNLPIVLNNTIVDTKTTSNIPKRGFGTPAGFRKIYVIKRKYNK